MEVAGSARINVTPLDWETSKDEKYVRLFPTKIARSSILRRQIDHCLSINDYRQATINLASRLRGNNDSNIALMESTVCQPAYLSVFLQNQGEDDIYSVKLYEVGHHPQFLFSIGVLSHQKGLEAHIRKNDALWHHEVVGLTGKGLEQIIPVTILLSLTTNLHTIIIDEVTRDKQRTIELGDYVASTEEPLSSSTEPRSP